MQALIDSHLFVHDIKTKQFFQAAYIWKFKRHCLDIALANDAKRFDEVGYIPPYVTEYVIAIYGVH